MKNITDILLSKILFLNEVKMSINPKEHKILRSIGSELVAYKNTYEFLRTHEFDYLIAYEWFKKSRFSTFECSDEVLEILMEGYLAFDKNSIDYKEINFYYEKENIIHD